MKRISLALIAALLITGVSCNRDPKAVAQGYVQKGNRYFDAGKYKEASLMYRKAIAKNRVSGEAWYQLAQAEFKLGHLWPEGVNALEYAVNVSPGNGKAIGQLGDLYLAWYLGSHDEGWKKKYDALVAKVKDNTVESNRMKGATELYINKKFKEACRLYEAAYAAAPEHADKASQIVFPLVQAMALDERRPEAEKLARATLDKYKDFEPLYDFVADSCLRTNRVADAEAILKQKAANNPKSLAAARSLAGFYWSAKRFAEMNQIAERVAGNAKDFPNGRLAMAKFFSGVGDHDSAIRYLRAGLSDSRRKAEYQKEIAREYVAQNKKEDAVRTLGEVLKEKPDDSEARALNAELMVETDPARAATELQQALTKIAATPEMRLNLGRAFLAKRPLSARDIDQAKFNFEEAIRLPRNEPVVVQATLGLGQALLLKQDFAGAIASANKALERNPKLQGAKLLRATAQAQLGNFGQARSDLGELLAANPKYPQAALQLARVSMAEKKYAEAEERFSKMIAASPDEFAAVAGLADTYTAQRKFDKALAFLNEQVGRQQNPARQNDLRLMLGSVAAISGNRDLAISSFKAVTEKDPGSTDAWSRLGLAYRSAGDLNRAIGCLRKAKELQAQNPTIAARISSELAVTLERNGQRQEARSLYEEVLKTRPDDVISLNNLAYVLAESDGGDLDKALQLAQSAKQKAPDHPDVADTLGWIYIRKQLTDPAIEIFRDLTAKHPENPSFQYHLAMALYQKGNKPEAKKAAQAALQRKPSKEDEAKIRELMGKIG